MAIKTEGGRGGSQCVEQNDPHTHTHLVLADGMVAEQEVLTAADLQHVASDVRRHTFLLLLDGDVHRANLASDRLRDDVLRHGIVLHLHRNLAALSRRRHDPQAD